MSTAANWLVVRSVISATNDGASVMSAMPGLVNQLIDEDAWREFSAPGSREPVRHATFAAFVQAEAPSGLSKRIPQLIALCDEPTAEKVRRLLRGEIEPASTRGGDRKSELFQNSGTVLNRETADHLTARLKRVDPDLAARVVAGEVTPNAAAREKGWRRPRIVLSTPERIASALRRHLTTEDVARVAALLTGGGHDG